MHRLQKSSSDSSVIINHAYAHTLPYRALLRPPLLFYGLTCHKRGMTATLGKKGGEEMGEGGEERCGFRVDGEGGLAGVSVSWKGERRWKTNSETGPEKRKRERRTKKDSHQMCAESPAQWKPRENHFCLFMRPTCRRWLTVYFSIKQSFSDWIVWITKSKTKHFNIYFYQTFDKKHLTASQCKSFLYQYMF